MAIKTFNVDEEAYRKFSQFCKENGLSMSKQIEIFIKSQLEEEPTVREEYLQKLDRMKNPDGYLMRAAKDYSGYVGI